MGTGTFNKLGVMTFGVGLDIGGVGVGCFTTDVEKDCRGGLPIQPCLDAVPAKK